MTNWLRRYSVLAALALFFVSPCLWSENQSKLAPEEMEKFLKTGKVLKSRPASKGITGTLRVTLSDGTFTHDAHVQSIDESKTVFQTDRGTELNFRDSYRYNIAAYHLGVLLGLGDSIPICVERKVNGKTSAVSWWVDDLKFDEERRVKDKIEPPDQQAWNEQMFVVRVFDQLIYNTDRNLGNLLIDNNWRIWMIDHSRTFRLLHSLQNPKNLVKCDRNLLARMKELKEDTLVRELRSWANTEEIKALLARRDLIVKFFEDEVQKKGEAAVLYTLARK